MPEWHLLRCLFSLLVSREGRILVLICSLQIIHLHNSALSEHSSSVVNSKILELISWRFPMTLLNIARLWKQIEYFLGVVISTGFSSKKSCMHSLRSYTLHPFFNALLIIVLNFFWFPEDIHIVWKWFLVLNRVGQMWFTLTNNCIGHSRGNQPLTSTSSFLKFRFWVTLPFLRYLTP